MVVAAKRGTAAVQLTILHHPRVLFGSGNDVYHLHLAEQSCDSGVLINSKGVGVLRRERVAVGILPAAEFVAFIGRSGDGHLGTRGKQRAGSSHLTSTCRLYVGGQQAEVAHLELVERDIVHIRSIATTTQEVYDKGLVASSHLTRGHGVGLEILPAVGLYADGLVKIGLPSGIVGDDQTQGVAGIGRSSAKRNLVDSTFLRVV